MVGLPTRLLIAQRVLEQLEARAKLPFSSLDRRWFMFGALGPAIGDFIPSEMGKVLGAAGRTPYYAAWRLVLEIAVGNPNKNLPGAVPTLRALLGLLEKMKHLVAVRDFDGMVALRDSGALETIKTASNDLGTILKFFADTKNLGTIADAIGATSRPKIDDPLNVAPPSSWTGRDFLHWKRTGEFATALFEEARRTGDSRFVSYALGWLVCYATLVCGSGFINSVAGSSYRTHWWRTRWIANFVDAWVWGFYGAGASVDDQGHPTPPFDSWPSLCAAKLHDALDLTGGLSAEELARWVVLEDPQQPLPKVLPQEFTDFWLAAWNKVYQPVGDPLFTADRLQAGYLMVWLVLWFQTSGDVIGCNPRPSATPPASCGANPQPPDWIDPTQKNPATGNLFTPPTPNAEHDPDDAEIACGIILALLGAASLFFGGGAIGVGAIVGGIALIVDGEKQLNWDELECQLHWLSQYVFNGLSALHKITVLGGFQQPYASDFDVSQQTLPSVGGDTLPLSYDSAPSTCRSRVLDGLRAASKGALLNWMAYASGEPETPQRMVWPLGGLWPSAFVDDLKANPGGASLLVAPKTYDAGVERTFGPALQNAVQLLEAFLDKPFPLPNWNLDGDRGLGWLTWIQKGPYQLPLQTISEV